MTPRQIDSLDLVEMVIAFEEAFDIEIPNDVLEHFGSPSEMVDRLERLLSNQRPNKTARAWLRKLAKEQQRPELAEGKLLLSAGAKLPLCLTNVPAPCSGF
jgi:Phosphopantetheine attachment site